jgi:hypothetical protein
LKKYLYLAVAAAIMLCSCSSQSHNSYKVDSFPDTSAENSSAQISPESSVADETKSDEMYDVSPIVAAYKSKDTSSLDELQSQIYSKACEILDEIISDSMDDYQKELAVHDYIIANCTYDKGALGAIPHENENSDNPYGALINGQAICKGYTTAFRMFMGMLGIKCGTVHASDIDGEEHAWNTVELDGNWYYVDCTWDDPVPDTDGRAVAHTYFNVSKDFISQQHNLPDGVPDTPVTENSFASREAVKITDYSMLKSAIQSALDRNYSTFVIILDDSLMENLVLSKTDYAYDYYLDFSDDAPKLDSALTEVADEFGVEIRGCTRTQTDGGTALSFEISI